MDKDKYLARIGFVGVPTPDLAGLESLCQAHLHAVPFENFDIHLGVALRLDEASLFRKIVSRSRGGFCYELNGLFAWLLRQVGFRVDLLSARVVRKSSIGSDFDHMALRVWCDGQAYLVDVGFGDASTPPLRLLDGAVRTTKSARYRLSPLGREMRYEVHWQGGEVKGYELSLVSRRLRDFEAMCRHHQVSARSWFTNARVCVLWTAEGVLSLIDGALKLDNQVLGNIHDSSDYLRTLRHAFGLELPRMPLSRAQNLEHRLRQQGLIWEHRARKVLGFAGRLALPSS